jgi:hypothetical protein
VIVPGILTHYIVVIITDFPWLVKKKALPAREGGGYRIYHKGPM